MISSFLQVPLQSNLDDSGRWHQLVVPRFARKLLQISGSKFVFASWKCDWKQRSFGTPNLPSPPRKWASHLPLPLSEVREKWWFVFFHPPTPKTQICQVLGGKKPENNPFRLLMQPNSKKKVDIQVLKTLITLKMRVFEFIFINMTWRPTRPKCSHSKSPPGNPAWNQLSERDCKILEECRYHEIKTRQQLHKKSVMVFLGLV